MKLPEFSTYDGQFVTPSLAIGSCPKPDQVHDIVSTGIRSIVNLVAKCGRLGMAYVSSLPEDIEWEHLAFWDGWLGPDASGYRESLSEGYARYVVQCTAKQLRDKSPLLIHCAGGIGRSGNLTAIMLAASSNVSPDEAIGVIRRYRPVVADFAHEGFWRNTDVPKLVQLARTVLSEPHTPADLLRERVLNG